MSEYIGSDYFSNIEQATALEHIQTPKTTRDITIYVHGICQINAEFVHYVSHGEHDYIVYGWDREQKTWVRLWASHESGHTSKRVHYYFDNSSVGNKDLRGTYSFYKLWVKNRAYTTIDSSGDDEEKEVEIGNASAHVIVDVYLSKSNVSSLKEQYLVSSGRLGVESNKFTAVYYSDNVDDSVSLHDNEAFEFFARNDMSRGAYIYEADAPYAWVE